MGKKLEADDLSGFGKMIAKRMDERSINMFEVVMDERVASSPGSMSRYLRLQRKPPERIIAGIIEVLGFSEEEGIQLRKLAEAGARPGPRPGVPFSSRLIHRRFADYDLNALLVLIRSLGWYCELNDSEDEYAYDLKVAEAEGLAEFVLVNFPNPQRAQPDVLLRGAGGMFGAYPGTRVTLFYEGVAGALGAYQKSDRRVRQLQLEVSDAEATDLWLREASGGKGRIVHGGNLIQVLAEYLEPTKAVRDYLEAEGR